MSPSGALNSFRNSLADIGASVKRSSSPKPTPAPTMTPRASSEVGRSLSPMPYMGPRSYSEGSSSTYSSTPSYNPSGLSSPRLNPSSPPTSPPATSSEFPSLRPETPKPAAKPKPQIPIQNVRLTLVGAGVSGLAFAIHLASKVRESEESGNMFRKLKIHIYDGRIRKRENGRFTWLGPDDTPPNVRRQQVITLQDDVMALFESDGVPISDHIWKHAPGERMWPTSRQTPICVVEDRLLQWAQQDFLPEYIELHDQRMTHELFQTVVDVTDYLVIADGGGPSSFSALPELGFRVEELGEADTALGVYYERTIEDRDQIKWMQAMNVYLTLFNTIYLVNSFEARRGYLNIRVPPSYMEILNQNKEKTIEELEGSGSLVKERIAQIIRAGLDMFDIPDEDVKAINYITLPMRWVNPPVKAVEMGEKRLLAVVLGDAALKHHFWPGRGANSGLKGSVNLSWHFLHYLQDTRRKSSEIRVVDFSKYAGFMTELKLREHEGRGEYVQRLDIEECFRDAYGPVLANDGEDLENKRSSFTAHHIQRVPKRAMTISAKSAFRGNPSSLHPDVRESLSKYLEPGLMKRLIDRRNNLQNRHPFTQSTVVDQNFVDALARLNPHDVTIKLLLCTSGEWPTGEMASTQEVRPSDSLWPKAKEEMEMSYARTALRKLFANHGIDQQYNSSDLMPIIRILESTNPVIVGEALDKLRTLTNDPGPAIGAIVEAGLLKPLVELLWHREETIVEQTAAVVHNISAVGVPEKRALIQAAVLDKIRVVLSSSHNPPVLAECCGTIAELAKDMGREEFFVEAGLVYPLVGLLADQSDIVYYASLCAINQLISGSDKHKQAIITAGILHRLRGVLQSGNAFIAKQICLVITALCATPDYRFELARSRIPSLLVLMLGSDPPKDVVADVLLATRVFAGGDEREWIQLVQDGLIDRLVPLLSSEDAVVTFNATAIVNRITDIVVLRPGAVKPFTRQLVNLLWHKDPRITQEAADALRNLALGTDADKTILIEAGVLPKLAVPLETKLEDDEFCLHACQLIINLGPKYFHQKVIKNGFVGPLGKLATSTHYKPLKKVAQSAAAMVKDA